MEGRDGLQQLETISLPNFTDIRRQVRGFERTAGIERNNWLNSSPESPPELLDVANVEEGFFDMLGVRPLLGRFFHAGDDFVENKSWGGVISYEGWQHRFGGDPNVIGKEFGPFRIIGVLPRDFIQPAPLVGSDVEFWVILNPNDRRYTDRRRRNLKILARLAPGVSLERARSEVSSAQGRVAALQPMENRMADGTSLGAGVNSLRDATIGTGARPMLVFLGASVLLLLLAGTNAANLLLVRGLERDGELSLRRALGATRARLTGNLVAESVSLAVAGGVMGLLIAVAGVAAFRRFGPQTLPRMNEVAVNPRIVLAGVLLSMAVGILVGLIPAIRSSGADLLANLRSSLTAFSPRGTRLRTALAATQLALALMLGVGASLLFRSFVYIRGEKLGFESKERVTFSVLFKKQRPWETWDQVVERVSNMPGVTAVGAASSLPFETPKLSVRVVPAEQDRGGAIAPVSGYAVSPGYFATAKIPLARGRNFDSSDRPESRRVAIVNERFARTTYGDGNPVGRILRLRSERDTGSTDLEIVGMVGNVVQARIEDGVLPAVYLPHTQAFGQLNVMVATRRAPEDISRELRRSLADAGLMAAPVMNFSSMQARIDKSLAAPRFQMLLIGAFAAAAVLLAAIGLYGTLAFTVRSRTRELGIRLAMGASQRQIFELVLRQGGSVLAFGLLIGVAGALVLTRLLQGFLYRVSPLDPVAFVLAALVVALAMLAAALRPAGRAARVDPISSMREGI
jgi:predicted permease